MDNTAPSWLDKLIALTMGKRLQPQTVPPPNENGVVDPRILEQQTPQAPPVSAPTYAGDPAGAIKAKQDAKRALLLGALTGNAPR